MVIYTVDFETYWSSEYTLSKLTTEAYVRDPQFSVHMVGIKRDDGRTVVLTDAQFRDILDNGLREQMQGGALLCQNTAFDGFILACHYDVVPARYLDTMSMFRAVYPHKRASLKVIAESLGLQAKGGASGYDVVNTRGKWRLFPSEWRSCAEYCRTDVEIAWEAYQLLLPHFSERELRLIDATLRMFTQPRLILRPEPLMEELLYERDRKTELLARAGEDRSIFSSNEKFAALLKSLGVSPPVKPSPTALRQQKGLHERVMSLRANGIRLTPENCAAHDIPWSWAFGKSDVEFKHLLNHDDPAVVAAAEARLGIKSTIGETRAARFYGASQRGPLPVPLGYWGAATGRWSGQDKMNLQNLTRGSRLRKAIEAPDGYLLAVCDLAAIEARCLAWVAGQEDALQIYRDNGDIYCDMATKIYGRPITKENKRERQVGKVAILGSGYGMGWRKFQEFVTDTAKVTFSEEDAEQLGVIVERFLSSPANDTFVRAACPSFIDPRTFAVHCAVCEYIIKAYRDSNYKITRLWADCGDALGDIRQGRERQVGYPDGVVTTCAEGFRFPEQRYIRYSGLTPHVKGKRVEWTRDTRDGVGHMTPGLATENIIQALARHIMADQMLTLIDEGYTVVLSCHDEIVLCEPEAEADAALARMVEVMSTAPAWARGIPLSCEGSVAKSYGEAK